MPGFIALFSFLCDFATRIIYSKYLKKERVDIIEQNLPNCIYKPAVNKLKKRFMLKFAAERMFHTPLGHFSFIGEYDDVKIEDFVCHTPSDPNRDEDPNYYCETILIYSEIPPDSVLNKYRHVYFELLKNHEPFSETEVMYRNAYKIKNTNLIVHFKRRKDNRSEYIYELEHGLANKLVEIFKTYKPDNLHFAKNMLILSIDESIGFQNEFDSSNDNFVDRIDEIYDTVGKIHELVNWHA